MFLNVFKNKKEVANNFFTASQQRNK